MSIDRWATAFAVFALAVSVPMSGFAQAGERMKERQAELQKRFTEADANGDGKLSRDEAKARMPRVYEHFDEIDAAHAGAISMQDIEAWLVKQRQARKAKS